MFDRNDCEPCNDSIEQDTGNSWLSMLPFLDVAALKREERRGMAKKAKAWRDDCNAELASDD